MSPRSAPGADPRRIGRFTVSRRLGMGGMSVVYEALDERIGRRVALKLMLVDDSDSDRERLRREAQALARLSHPHVVEVFEIGEHEGKAYVAMELVEGHPLDRWLRLRERSPAEIVEVFGQAGEGLAAAHAEGMVHRDFKPGNVLVGSDGRVRVVDFGLVRESGAVELASAPDGHDSGGRASPDRAEISGGSLPSAGWSEALTRTGAMMGTPAYMSPEQLSGVAAGPASDQFAFCVALFEALYGQHPFVVDGNWQQLPYNVLEGQVQRPSGKHRVPAALGKLVMRGLALRPEARWPGMDALLAQLRRALDPRRPRWLRSSMLGVGVVVLGLGALHVNAQAPAVDRCEDAAATMRATWSPESREELRQTWLDTGLAGAADTWTRVDGRMQTYVDDWWGIHHAACDGATHSATSASCLARMADGLRMHVQMMARPDETLLHNAVEMMGQLPALERCGAALEVSPDELPEAAPPWQDELDRLDMLMSARKSEEALPLIDALLTRAASENSAWLMAEVQLRLGWMLARDSDPTGAGAAFEDAYLGAKRQGRDRLAADAALALLQLYGEMYYRPAEATRWAGHARAETERVGEPLATSRYLNAAGRALRSEGRLEEALDLHQQALELQKSLPSIEPREIARSHFQIGSVLGLLGRGPEGHPFMEEALRVQERELGPRHPQVAATLTNLGVFLVAEGSDEEALAALTKALEISQESMPNDAGAGWMAEANISGILARQGRPQEAAERLRHYLVGFQRQQQLASDEPHSVVSATLCEIAIFEGRYAEALADCETAVSLQDDEPEQNPGPLVSMGRALVQLGRLDEAITAFSRASELAERMARSGRGMKIFNEQALGESKADLGRALVASGRYGEALVALEGARDRFQRSFGEKHPQRLELEVEISRAMLKLGRGVEARPRLEATMRELEEGPNPLRLAYALCVLAGIELEAEELTSAHEHAERAQKLVEGLDLVEAQELTALARFAQARALGSSPRDRHKAVALAKQSEATWVARGELRRRELDEVRAWLSEHGARRPA